MDENLRIYLATRVGMTYKFSQSNLPLGNVLADIAKPPLSDMIVNRLLDQDGGSPNLPELTDPMTVIFYYDRLVQRWFMLTKGYDAINPVVVVV